MNAWRRLPDLLARGEDLVLVTVAKIAGSAPRETGASMLVGSATTADTIGGGRLEWEAIAHARVMLEDGSATHLHRFPLAASLGQCCGGVVWLLFERIAAAEQAAWDERAARLAAGEPLYRQLVDGAPASRWLETPCLHADEGAAQLTLATAGQPWRFAQHIALERFPVLVFGAGHVGEAIVRALLPLAPALTWVDTREDVFPPDLAGQLRCIVTDTPEAEIAHAPPGCFILVLTHSHALDMLLCEHVFVRDDFTFFGLIGSRAKRRRFEQRLVQRGVDPVRLARMQCPIGIAGIRSKHPAAIAVSVVAQLLQVKEAAVAGAAATAPHDDILFAHDETTT